MNGEHNIIGRILEAQHNIDEADNLIRDYFPFIKHETAKAIGRIPIEGKDDELSIALMGFHEAIEEYKTDKGAFLNFAAVVMRRRIFDFLRRENQTKSNVSWELLETDDKQCNIKQTTVEDSVEDSAAMKWEIIQLTKELNRLGITISDVADNCPRYEKAITGCRQAVNYLIDNPRYLSEVIESGKLPVNIITEATSVKRKTLERHRKYLIALAVIYFKKYDCMIEYLTGVFNLKKGGK